MQDILGASISVFIGINILLCGFAAYATGEAVANNWQAAWRLCIYCAFLGAAARFLMYALFDGELFSLVGYLISTCVLLAMALFSHRLTRARKMVTQYPWLYERAGLFGWRSRV